MPHPVIPMVPLAGSSNITAHGYDASTQTLAVAFKGGGIYHYAGVSPQQAAALSKADSFGSHLHANIKGKHKSTHTNPKNKD